MQRVKDNLRGGQPAPLDASLSDDGDRVWCGALRDMSEATLSGSLSATVGRAKPLDASLSDDGTLPGASIPLSSSSNRRSCRPDVRARFFMKRLLI